MICGRKRDIPQPVVQSGRLRNLSRVCCILLSAFSAICVPALSAEEAETAEKTKTELVEEAEAAEEERILRKQGRILDMEYELVVPGRLVLTAQAMDEDRPSVLGYFKTSKQAYLVKLGDESLREKLALFNQKTVTLAGKVRNNGKYLIVQAVLTQTGEFRVVAPQPGRGRM
jgi:hypothetical protein